MSSITPDPVNLSQYWGVEFKDYTIDKGTSGAKTVDFQDLMVAVSEKRATAVEGEVNPLTTRIQLRNKNLDRLGAALADLTKQQAAFDPEAKGDAQSGTPVNNDTVKTIKDFFGYDMTPNEYKMWNEFYIQLCKSKIDALNNDAQTDMSRLQSLVDRRDESYSTATNLMSAISDSRANLIRNF